MGVRLYEQIGSDGLSALLRETIRSEVLVDLRVSSSEPILSAVDPILYSTTVHGDSRKSDFASFSSGAGSLMKNTLLKLAKIPNRRYKCSGYILSSNVLQIEKNKE